MPQIIPILTSIGSWLAANSGAIAAGSAIAGAGTTIGSTIANAVSGSSDQSGQPGQGQNAPAATPTPPDPSQAAGVESANRAKQALIARGQLPGLQDQTGGSLSPDYYNTMAQEFSGGFGANPGTTNPGANLLDIASSAPAGPNNLPALLQQLQGMQGLTTGASITG